MATTFTVVIADSDGGAYARQAAMALFAELDQMEGYLSRYEEASDVARINGLRAGQSTVVQPETFECLELAVDVQRAMGGAFDVAYGSAGPRTGRGRFELDASAHAVRVLAEGVRIDLGGIAKGFALDRMAELLGDWGLKSALLCASTSTMLALEAPPGESGWTVSFGLDRGVRHVRLLNHAFSASGRSVKGDHIVRPASGRPATEWVRCWSAAPTAGLADALSTAFMVMSEREIRDCCSRDPRVSAWCLRDEGGEIVTIADRLGAKA
ncbi:MAG: FAD:protein FMN transferase [Phycisphaerae bacterium]|nr:FAD:protein FMN transferase [Phycisphaerae bacterium]